MKALVLPVLLWSSLLGPSLAPSSDTSTRSTSLPTRFSAEQFDWRDVVPYLFDAAALPGEQGIKAVLENSQVMRAYVERELVDCGTKQTACSASQTTGHAGEVSKAIDQMVQEEIAHRRDTIFVDYKFARQPFPFAEIAVSKSEKHQGTFFLLALSDHSYTAADIQAKYGAPYDTDIFQWYSVFKYRMDSPRYSAKAVFEVDPTDGGVVKIAISLRTKKPKHNK